MDIVFSDSYLSSDIVKLIDNMIHVYTAIKLGKLLYIVQSELKLKSVFN